MFLSLFHWLVYTCNPGTFNLIFNILFFFSAIFISPLTLFSHRSVTFFSHEVNSSSSASFKILVKISDSVLDFALALRGKEGDLVREKSYKLSNVSDLVKIKPQNANSKIKFLSLEIKNTVKHLQSLL